VGCWFVLRGRAHCWEGVGLGGGGCSFDNLLVP